MTIQVVRTPSIITDIGNGAGPSAAWVDLANAQGAPGADFATVGEGVSIPNELRLSGFGFSLYDAVTAIEVKLYGTLDTAEGLAATLYWQSARSSGGTLEVYAVGLPQTLETLGWTSVTGTMPTPAELQAGIFEISPFAEGSEYELKGIELRATVTPATPANVRAISNRRMAPIIAG